MSTLEPTRSKWDLALDGIAELGQKIDTLGDRQADLQEQIIALRGSYTRAAPMALVMSLEGRVAALESGVAARILAHMQREEEERKERQREIDARHDEDQKGRAALERRNQRRVWRVVGVLILVVLAVFMLAGVVIWAELRV